MPPILFLTVLLLHARIGLAEPLTEADDEHLLKVLKPASRMFHDGWMQLHEQYRAEVEASKSESFDLLVYGDSITEAFRGCGFGRLYRRWDDNKAAWETLIASKYKAAVYSISGDKAMHLLWRLQHGEGPRDMAAKVVMVMIGTNDIGHLGAVFQDDPQRAVRAIFLGVRLVLDELAVQAPGAKLVVLSLPPLQLPGLQDGGRWQQLVDGVNHQLQQHAAEQQQAGRALQYVDCATPLFEAGGGGKANFTLIPDGIHPSGPGGWLLGQCVLGALQQALGESTK